MLLADEKASGHGAHVDGIHRVRPGALQGLESGFNEEVPEALSPELPETRHACPDHCHISHPFLLPDLPALEGPHP